MKEPPIVGIYRNCTDIKWCCEDCKYDSCGSNDYPCRMCVGDCFNAFEPTEGWERRRIMIIDGFQRECIEQAQLDRIDMVKDTVTGTATAKSYNVPAMQGWICPVCGRGLSPFTSVCPCKNGKGWEITC